MADLGVASRQASVFDNPLADQRLTEDLEPGLVPAKTLGLTGAVNVLFLSV